MAEDCDASGPLANTQACLGNTVPALEGLATQRISWAHRLHVSYQES